LIDFGLSKTNVAPGHMVHRQAGSPSYVAPEVIGNKPRIGQPSDMWSAGVVVFLLLAGEFPFYGDNTALQHQAIRGAHFKFDASPWAHTSPAAKDLIQRIFKADPAERLTAAEALQHDWIVKGGEARANPLHSAVASLKEFTSEQRFKRASLGLMSSLVDPLELRELKQVFSSMDDNRDGYLSIEELNSAITKSGVSAAAGTLFAAADVNHDGRLSSEEFVAATMQREIYLREENLRLVFQHLDKDDSGTIDRQELVQVFGEFGVNQMIAEADANDDGEIDFEEFKAMMSRQDQHSQVETGFFV